MQLPRPEAGSWNVQGAQQCLLLKEFRFILTVIFPRSIKRSKGMYSDFLTVLYSNPALIVKLLSVFISPAVPAWGSVNIHACVKDAATCPISSLPSMSQKGPWLLVTQLFSGFLVFDKLLLAVHKVIPRNWKCMPSLGDLLIIACLLLALFSHLLSGHSPFVILVTFSFAVLSCFPSANVNVSSFSSSFP